MTCFTCWYMLLFHVVLVLVLECVLVQRILKNCDVAAKALRNQRRTFYTFIFTFHDVEHLQNRLAPDITCIIAALNIIPSFFTSLSVRICPDDVRKVVTALSLTPSKL